MNNIYNLIQLFGSYNNLSTSETDERFTCTAKLLDFNVPLKPDLLESLLSFPQRDHIEVHIDGFGEAVSVYSASLGGSLDFLEELKAHTSFPLGDEELNLSARIIVNKKFDGNISSIYNIDNIVEYFSSLDLEQVSFLFSRYLKSNSQLVYEIQDIQAEPFWSESIVFKPKSKAFECYSEFHSRPYLINKRENVSNFTNASAINLTPEDFNLIKRCTNQTVNLLFDKLCLLYCLVFISNISKIDKDAFEYVISGYKNIQESRDFTEVSVNSLTDFLKIYKWSYNEGNLSDKIGLARNIISLHCGSSLFELEGEAYHSVKSGYEIYLKDNVQKYIEIKNSISENLISMSQKVGEMVDGFASSFKNNIAAFITFIVTVLIVNAVSEGGLNLKMSGDIAGVVIILLMGSFAYCIISIKEFNNKIDRYSDEYNNLKNRYKDILDKEDIDKIFHHDSDHKKNLNFLSTQLASYSILWLSTLLAIFLFLILR